MCGRDRYIPPYNGRWSPNFVDWLRLDINTIGYRLSGMKVKRLRVRMNVLDLNPVRCDR